MWLRDLLPSTILTARVWSFGYEAKASTFFGDGSADRIQQHAHTLVAELEAVRALSSTAECPIMFVCHGLGGILVKKALAHSATQTSKNVDHRYSIYISTYGILFMGTPHSGIEHATWETIAQEARSTGGAPSEMLKALTKDSETLHNITDQFAPLVKQFHIYFFWESFQTEMFTGKSYIVCEESAAPIWDNTERSGIHATHSEMCRFGSRESPDFQTILAALLRYAREAHKTIATRWSSARRFLATQRSIEASELIGFDVHNDNKPFLCESPRPRQGPADTRLRNKYFHVPHNVSSIFTGRDAVTRVLESKILQQPAPNRPHQQKRFVLYGLGGSGKTQFCLKFVQDNRDRFWGIFWIDASSIENAERALSQIGQLGGLGATHDAGMYWLTGLDTPWLLVIDNADDPTIDYSRFFPPGERGHILVTSRNSDCKIYATIGHYEFGNMEEEDAITLLLKAADHDGINNQEIREVARPIAKTLGYLALALIQAGASIRHGICTLEEYLDVFASYRTQIMNDDFVQGSDSYQYTVYTTWEVSVQKIESIASETAVDAIQILQVLAFLHFEQVPASMFERAWIVSQRREERVVPKTVAAEILEFFLSFAIFAHLYTMMFATRNWSLEPRLPDMLLHKGPTWNVYRFRQALVMLSRFSLIIKHQENDTWSMHPMVHFWARERLDIRDQKIWAEAAADTLALSITPGFESSSQAYRKSLVSHIDSSLQIERSLSLLEHRDDRRHVSKIVKFAAIYSECGDWIKARDMQEEAMIIKLRVLGQEHPETLDAMTALAWSYWNLSGRKKALDLQRAVVDTSAKALGTNHPKTLNAMSSLALTYWLCGNRVEAEPLAEKAVNGLKNTLGQGHPDTLTAMETLGRVYMHRGRPHEAKPLLIEVYQAREKMFGADYPDTLTAMAELGMTHHALGNLTEAELLLEAVVDKRKRVLGQQHAYTLWAINDLSKIYCDQGHPVEAELLLVNILDTVIRTLGKEHIGMSMTMMNLARAHSGQRQWAKARDTLTDLIEMQLRTLGPKHPDTLAARSELARTYRYLGRLDEAEVIFSDLIDAMSKIMGPEHPWTKRVEGQLSAIYISQGRLEEAEQCDLRLRTWDKKLFNIKSQTI